MKYAYIYFTFVLLHSCNSSEPTESKNSLEEQVITENKNLTPDQISNSSYLLTSLYKNGKIITGTGFILKYAKKFYLVTNFHVLSGEDPDTLDMKSTTENTPDTIGIWYHNTGRTAVKVIKYPLYGNGRQNFLIAWDTYNNHYYDIAVMPLNYFWDTNKIDYIQVENIDTSINFNAGQTLLVVGYPASKIKSNNFEASAYKVKTLEQKNKIQINYDTSLESGTSGSPVYYYNEKDNSTKIVAISSRTRQAERIKFALWLIKEYAH